VYLSAIFSNAGLKAEAAKAIDTLRRVNFFGFLLEAGAERSLKHESSAYHTGYYDCIRDIMNFEDRLAPEVLKKKVVPDFGALKTLLERGEITQGEYDKRIRERQ